MRPEFYDVYRDLNELYRRPRFDLRFARRLGVLSNIRDLRIVDKAITETVGDLGLSSALRPDARLFLLVNIHQMLVLPLAYAERLRLARLPVNEIVRDDVRTILKAAREESNEEEISGHAVVNAVSRVWRQLRSTELEVWG
jgi:hypothetical protein